MTGRSQFRDGASESSERSASAGEAWPDLLFEGSARLHLLCEAYRRSRAPARDPRRRVGRSRLRPLTILAELRLVGLDVGEGRAAVRDDRARASWRDPTGRSA